MVLTSSGEAGTAAAAHWWRRQVEEISSQIQLPGGVEGIGGATGRCALPAGFDVGTLGCLVAGLVARYNASGRVLITVGESGQWTPVAVDFADDPTFGEAMDRWVAQRTAAQAHLLPLAELVDPGLAGPAVAQVAVRLDATEWPLDTRPHLQICLDGDEVRLVGSSLADSVLQQLASHLRAMAEGWTDHQRLAGVAILSAAEREAVLLGAAGPVLDVPEGSVWDLIREVARRTPQAEAIVDDAGRISYGELVSRVEELAAELVGLGLRPRSLIGLCVPRSIDMVVGLLAIMSSGAAYVPIDPTYPPDRIAMMVDDADLAALVTERGQLDQLDAGRIPVVNVSDRRPAAGDGVPADRPRSGGDDLAYVIFTSGSTGRPKGVMVSHRALTNFVTAIAHEPGMTAQDRLLAVTTLSFDIAALELLVPLSVGGCVVVAGRETVVDPAALDARLTAEAITIMQATPATWQMLVDWGWSGRDDLRILCGGEALPVALAGALNDRCAELWNMYGPTETTIWSLATRLGDGDPVTIGKPIANTTVYVVGAHLELLADGVPGELLIGGLGLAEGYLGLAEMTTSRFIPDRFGSVPNGRLYRTGDLVRRRTDGKLDFIGRIDHQVKVRGFRIELGEVETALDTHPGVARSVAIVLPDPIGGTNQLVAYAVLHDAGTTDGIELRRYVAARLPEYMVPSTVVVLASFPLTLNGKIDRLALPAPDVTIRESERVAPRSFLERQLVHLWESTLGVSPIGVTDQVFELGASSLTTARLYAAVARTFDVTLPIAAAFQAPTIEQLAPLVDSLRQAQTDTGSHAALVPIRPQGSSRPLFLVHGGAGTVLLFEPLARRLGDDQPVFAFQAVGLYGARTPQRTVRDMATLYIEEMMSVQPHGPYRIGGYCFGALIAYEMACQLRMQGEKTELLVTFNGPSPSYLRQYRPLFDAEGALTDESGQRIRPAADGAADQLRQLWVAERSATKVARLAAIKAVRRARARLRGYRWRARFWLAITLRRPLPDTMREAGAFQRLAATAQDHYVPPRYEGDMLVIRAADLYHRDDLGWGDHVDGRVDVEAASGGTVTPRRAMTDAFVAPIVAAVQTRLRALDGRAALDDQVTESTIGAE